MAKDASAEWAHPRRQFVVDGERAKQLQRLGLGAGRHPFAQSGLDLGLVRRLERRDARPSGLQGHELTSCFGYRSKRITGALLIPKQANPTPLPGRLVRGSRTGRPAMALLD